MLVTTVKDEGPNILEWVAYHRMIGFTNIHVYQNDSFDTTQDMLVHLDRLGIIRYFNNSFRKTGVSLTYQNRAYRRAARHEDYHTAEWCMALDGDELLQINVGAGRITDLIGAVSDVDEIRLNWRVFGSSHLRVLDDRMQAERFVHANALLLPVRQPMPVKTLFRTAVFARPGIHRPRSPRIDAPRVCNGSGRGPDQFVERGFQVTDPEPYKFAQVNHYMVRDADSYLMKAARGSSSHPDRQIALDYWRRRNVNAEAATGMLRLLPALKAEVAELDQMSGGVLIRLRNRALRQWRLRIADIKQRPEMAELYAQLVSDMPDA